MVSWTCPFACASVRLRDKLDIWTPHDSHRAAPLIIAMLNKGWFDDAVGRVEGCEIFRGLMASGNLQ